ncbi:MAG: (2Fe-2S)-binding protein [Dehalococcoidales bacterium]|nr:(2Fe-2S)-binding protein [Dehalococcoidales bacterium]
MKQVSLTINGKEITAEEGANLLWTALDNDIYIPNLCAIREKEEPSASCRLCFVEIEGYRRPVTACTETVREGMVVNTRGEESLRLASTGFELLMASHPVDCAHCLANGNCELQKIAAHLKIRINTERFTKILPDLPVDESHPKYIHDPNKCVLCGRCVWMCRKNGSGAFGFAHRGFDRVVAPFRNMPMNEIDCTNCGECINICPTGALVLKNADRGQFG